MSSATPPPHQPGPRPSEPPQTDGLSVAPTRRTPRTALWVSLGGGALLVAMFAVAVVLQLSANEYDRARAAWHEAADNTTTAQDALAKQASDDTDAVANADAIVAAAPDDLVDTAARDAVAAAAASLDETVTEATDAAAEPLPDSPGVRPVVFWDLFGAAEEIRTDAAELDEQQDELTEASDALASDAAALEGSADQLYLSTDAAAPAFEAAHVNARNDEVMAFRDAQDELAAAAGVGSDAVDAMTAYARTADAVKVSEQEELASISDGLYANRLAAQDFARSIDGGVLVEFDWAPIVYGAGEGGSVGGYTTWNDDHGGHAVIQLSDSVAALWPRDVAVNLVAHEVGHAISSKCRDLYDDTDQASIEAFATAWAISMGYTGDGNGASLYGYPAQEVIDAAATCR